MKCNELLTYIIECMYIMYQMLFCYGESISDSQTPLLINTFEFLATWLGLLISLPADKDNCLAKHNCWPGECKYYDGSANLRYRL